MSRVQLALNVSDLDAAITFYGKLFGTEPAKRRPGYANFAIADPPLKLVLIENKQTPGGINHLGVEVESSDVVVAETRRFVEAGLTTSIEEGVDCCYGKQDKVWIEAPDGTPWEVYTVLEHVEMPAGQLRVVAVGGDTGACCTSSSAGSSGTCC